MGRPALRVAGMQARLVERNRARARRPDDRDRRRADESCRRRAHRDRERAPPRSRARRRRACRRRVLPLPGRAADRARGRRDGVDPAGRVPPRRRGDRGGRRRRCRHGLHRHATFPSLMTGNRKEKGPMGEPDPRRWKALAIVCAAFFMTVLDIAIVNVALPSIGSSLHFSETNLQWVITAYAITFGGFLLLGGRSADLLGRRRVFIVGVVVFTIASLVCGLAQ